MHYDSISKASMGNPFKGFILSYNKIFVRVHFYKNYVSPLDDSEDPSIDWEAQDIIKTTNMQFFKFCLLFNKHFKSVLINVNNNVTLFIICQ